MSEIVAPMPPDRHAAVILRFPVRAKAVANASADDTQLRLRNALTALDAALERQREAVFNWRARMADLHGNVGRLGSALEALQVRLGGLDGQVQGLHDAAAQLDAQADLLLRASAQTR